MNKKEVYIRDYQGKEPKKWDSLMALIKKDNHENIISINPYKKNYLDYDGDFITITSIETSPNGYDKPHTAVKITIEKIGPDLTKQSAIEKLLINEGFKNEIKKKN
jgi:hypothetical protein